MEQYSLETLQSKLAYIVEYIFPMIPKDAKDNLSYRRQKGFEVLEDLSLWATRIHDDAAYDDIKPYFAFIVNDLESRTDSFDLNNLKAEEFFQDLLLIQGVQPPETVDKAQRPKRRQHLKL